MGAGLIAPLLPVYAHDFGAGGFQIGLIFGSFSLTRSFFVPYFGKLSDRKEKRTIITVGLFLYFSLSVTYVMTSGIASLIVLRLGQGFASAMILPVAQAYVGLITPARHEGRIMGLFNLSIYGGLSLGPLLGGLVKDWVDIQASFLFMGGLTLFGFIICWLFLPPEDRSINKNSFGGKQSISYLKLLRSHPLLYLFTYRACFTIAVGMVWTFLPLLAGTKIGLSSTKIGLLVMIHVLAAGIVQVPMGYLADRVSKRGMIIAGGILAIVSLLLLNPASTFGDLCFVNTLFGLAGGISSPSVMALGVIEGRQTNAMGAVMGLLALAHSLGMLIGPLLAGIVIDLFSMQAAFILGAFIVLIGLINILNSYRSCS
jgi:MFS family permease